MKINPLGPSGNPYQKRVDAQRTEQPGASKPSKDKLEISHEAQQMKLGKDINELRQEKVNELKKRVETGEYKVDPKETARKFIQFWTNKE